MFAGGGSIPLEAIRLGCDVTANELNPVAHVIELCALVYSQRYGLPDRTARGATGEPDSEGNPTWGGLPAEVRYWAELVFEKIRSKIGDLYPLIPDPAHKGRRTAEANATLFRTGVKKATVPAGYLVPVAYLWTRLVPCKNPTCGAEVPMLRHTWLCKRLGRFVAMKVVKAPKHKRVRFTIVESDREDGFDFEPSAFSKGGNATCPFCGTVADSEYVKRMGQDRGFGVQPTAIMCVRPGKTGKVYIPFDNAANLDEETNRRLADIYRRFKLTPPTEPLEANPRSFDIQRYGFTQWRAAFTERQNLLHLTIAEQMRATLPEIERVIGDRDRTHALYTCVALSFSRLVTQHNAFSFIHTGGEKIDGPWGDGKFPMSWDFAEANPFSEVTASYRSALEWSVRAYEALAGLGAPATAVRGSATQLSFADGHFDAVITDPPYYDNYSYSNLSDAFYVWLKRSIGNVHSSHFASELTPKKAEAIKATYRHNGDDDQARRRYESLMTESLREARRVLKPNGIIAIVYAHKTTLGWATLVDALRSAGFTIVEAWPLKTEAKGGRKKVDKAMLASSVFLAARKREAQAGVGNYEDDVQPELERIVRERVDTLWDQGISGADLVIACVGAGLRAFTRYERVEYANGEEVPAERFLAEVETVVLETILNRLSQEAGARGQKHDLAGVDPVTRFYILWRYTYRAAWLDAGEAIVFANGTHVELDGPQGLSGRRPVPLLEKKKGKYRLLDFQERGQHEKLGLSEDGTPAPLIDALHRTLWLMKNRPLELAEFLRESRVNREQMRLVAQALAGPALKGGQVADVSPTGELAALAELTANWRAVVEEGMLTPGEMEDRRRGQKRLFGTDSGTT